MKMGRASHKEEKDFLHNPKKKEHKRYCTIHCTGYLRSWLPSEVGLNEDCDADKESTNFSCLVAIGRLHPYTSPQSSAEIKVKPREFVTRYSMDGKFVYVDQRATAVLGYLPQELLGTSCYEYFHQDDHTHLAEQHKAVLQSKEKVLTNSYKFKAKDGSFITLKSQWFSFINPWTQELEYIVSINTVVSGHCFASLETASLPESSHSSEDTSKRPFLSVPGMCGGTVLGAGRLGTEIANEILDLQRLHSPPFVRDLSPTKLLSKSPAPPVPCSEVEKKDLVRLSPSEIEKLDSHNDNIGSFPIPEHLLRDGSTLDFENNETTLAALMNYLEADGGLGDSGDLNTIHWNL